MRYCMKVEKTSCIDFTSYKALFMDPDTIEIVAGRKKVASLPRAEESERGRYLQGYNIKERN